ncbi:AAA domain-containing protein [Sorangium sp. So ce145]|uniref:AAA domain-containing protein n=1 Tax=Sorangium sp. So ce145 TaxID=3133285 RepID=UPI003F626737
MAELFFQNIVDRRPDIAQKATYNNLQAFYQYLDRAKRYLERSRFELAWAPLGTVVRLDPPRNVRDAKRWRAELGQLLTARHLWLQVTRGPEIQVIGAHAGAGVVQLDAAPAPGAEVELHAKEAGPALPLVAVVLGSQDDIRKALGQAGPVWIELDEPEGDGRDDTVEAFFDEDLGAVYEVSPGVRERNDYTAARRLRVLDQDRDRLALLLDRLPQTQAICVRPNTYVVDCELRAIRALEDQPVAGHRPLIRLFENQAEVTWPQLLPRLDPLIWQVLTDDDRPGTSEQREFVDRALRTRDFMLLEGPPGSGKTTAIVELVLQLAARNRRVLLCASTHVAVDNVVERLKDMKRNGDPVLLVRIGDERRVAEGIKGYCLHRMVDTELRNTRAALQGAKGRNRAQAHMLEALRAEDGQATLQRVLLDCAEVVCGTTIGILQHPDIRVQVRSGGPWEPTFDTLILDEASKTPFAEFLVPALLAKHWIIVGDRRQLSPYVEEGWIETNIEAAIPDGVVSREDASQALADVFTIGRGSDGALLVASENADLRDIYAAQLAGLFPEEPIVRLDADDTPSPLLLGAARAVIGTPAQLAAVEGALPLATRIVRLPTGELLAARRRHDARSQRHPKDEEPWAKAVAWRLVRDYELRLLPELLADGDGLPSAGTYAREIDALQPCEGKVPALPRVRDDIDRVRRVALPSILESLQVGFDPRRDSRGRRFWDNALALGLPSSAKAERLVPLRYQHRMHPDIASFPHARIYGGKLLDTPDNMAQERLFPCPRYRTRVALLDVRGQETRSPISNEAEARVIVEELQALSAWAKSTLRRPPWSAAVLTFYRGQERRIRDLLRDVTGQRGQRRYFTFRDGDAPVLTIELCTVDRYQGHEADIVLLSFVRTETPGFLNSPNRLNVAITRARYQLVLIGHAAFLARQTRKAPLCALLVEDMKRRGCVEYRYREG